MHRLDTSLRRNASSTSRVSYRALSLATLSTCSEQPKKLVPGATMTDRNRSFGAALAIVAVLIAVTALAAMLAP